MAGRSIGSGWIFLIVKVMIAAAIMIILVRNIDFKDIYIALIHPRYPLYIVIGFLLLLPNIAIQWYRWHYLLSSSGGRISFLESFSSLLGGLAVGFVTPGRIGEMSRFLFLHSGDPIQAAGLVLIDKLFSLVVILFAGVSGLLYFLFVIIHPSAFVFWPLFVIVFLTVTIALLIVLHPGWIQNALYHLSLILPYRDKMRRLIGCLDPFDQKRAARFLFLTFIQYGIYIAQFCFLARAFFAMNMLRICTAAVSVILAKTLLPISLADLGVREGAAIYFFMKFGMDKVSAFNSSILLFAINVLIPTLLGLFFLPRMGWRTSARKG